MRLFLLLFFLALFVDLTWLINQCPIIETKESVDLQALAKLKEREMEALIRITALTDAQWNKISVELNEGQKLAMNFTVGTSDDMKVSFPERKISVANGTRLPIGAQRLHLDICLLKHWYTIKVNETQLGGRLWPKEWWNAAPWKSITSMKLDGQMLLLFDMRYSGIDDLCIDESKSTLLPKVLRIGGLWENATFLFRFQPLNRSNGTVTVKFSDSQAFEKKTGHDVFAIHVKDMKTVTLDVFYDGQQHSEEERLEAKFADSDESDVFELYVSITKQFNYVIKLNGIELFHEYANLMPVCGIKFVRAEGDAMLLVEPELGVKPPLEEKGQNVTKTLEKIVNYGDKIVVGFQKMHTGDKIHVKLLHNLKQCSKNSDIVAQFEFEVGAMNKKFACEKPKIHGVDDGELSAENSYYSMRIDPDRAFNLEILMADNSFYGRARKLGYWTKLCPYYNYYGYLISPWTINQIHVYSTVTMNPKDIRVEESSNDDSDVENNQTLVPCNRANYTKINEVISTDPIDYSVFVNLTFKQFDSSSVLHVHFLHNALQHLPPFGSMVFYLMLKNKFLEINSYSPQKEWFFKYAEYKFNVTNLLTNFPSNTAHPQTTNNISMHNFQVGVTKNGFSVRLNGHGRDDGNKTMFYPMPNDFSVHDIEYVTHKFVELTSAKISCDLCTNQCLDEELCAN